MKHDYLVPENVDQAIQLLDSCSPVFVDLIAAISILENSENKSYDLHWNSPVQGKVVIIPQLTAKIDP